MSKEAMKLALEAFETLTQYNMVRANIFRRFEPTCTGDYVDLKEFREKAEPAITALREALAEQPAPMIRGDIRDGLVDDEPAQRKPPSGWIAVSDRIPLESDGEVLVRMRDGRCEIAWATYWHGASNAFAQWTFRDPDEDEAPTHWMLIPAIEAAHGIKENT